VDRKSKQMIRRARRMNPGAFVAVCGCMARGSADVTSLPTGVDFAFDTRQPQVVLTRLAQKYNITVPYPHGNSAAIPRAGRTRAFLKIQDGCDRFCAYCIVPHVRGPVVSRMMEDILAQANDMISYHFREIVLTGIQVAAYGNDILEHSVNLPALIRRVGAIPGLERLRLSSIDPWAINDDFVAAVIDTPALCAHFHLSLQSGCDATLARMNRRYTTAQYAAVAARLRAIWPNMALTTDIIVGFPGETDADFAASLAFAQEMELARIHVFPYSPRTGTPAADMPQQISKAIKDDRGKAMRDLAARLQQQFLLTQVGQTTQVLFETEATPGVWQGHTSNYCTVQVQGANLENTLQKVYITAAAGNILEGALLHGHKKD